MGIFLLISLLFSFGTFATAADNNSSTCPADGRSIQIIDAHNIEYYDESGLLTNYIVNFELVNVEKDFLSKTQWLKLGPPKDDQFAQLYSLDCKLIGGIKVFYMPTVQDRKSLVIPVLIKGD